MLDPIPKARGAALKGFEIERAIRSDQMGLRLAMSGKGPTPLEETLLRTLREVYAMTEEGGPRWSRRTRERVRAVIEGAWE